nr:unnamed protein product [Callosobruchus analis]
MRANLFTVDSYNLKMKLPRNRKLLKGSRLTLNEDMTPSRHSLYKKPRRSGASRRLGFTVGKYG